MILAEQLQNYVKFPDKIQAQQDNIRRFFEIANFPNVAACIDGTHIPIGNPGGKVIMEKYSEIERENFHLMYR